MHEPMERTANVYSTLLGAVFVPIGGGLAYLWGVRGIWMLPVALLIGGAVGFGVRRVSLAVAHGAGDGFLAFVWPSGKTSPYETEFSGAQSLAAAGDIEGAIAWYDAAMARMPDNALVRLQSADLHARHGRPERAEVLFVEARRLTTERDRELYCTQRLIDLHLGPGGTPARAFPELRRLIERFPDSREAAGARVALARLKREVLEG